MSHETLKTNCMRANWTGKCVLHRKSIGVHCWKIIVQSIAFASLDWGLGEHALLLCCCFSLVDLFSLDLTHWLSMKICGARWSWVLNRQFFPHNLKSTTWKFFEFNPPNMETRKNFNIFKNLLRKNFENTTNSAEKFKSHERAATC